MAIEAIGATVTYAASAIGSIVGFTLPADLGKEYEVTDLGDTRETFKLSAMSQGQEFAINVRLDPESPQLTKGNTGEFIVTLPKQTSGSAAGKTYTFTGFIRDVSAPQFDVGGSEGVTIEYTIRLTTEVVEVDEA